MITLCENDGKTYKLLSKTDPEIETTYSTVFNNVEKPTVQIG